MRYWLFILLGTFLFAGVSGCRKSDREKDTDISHVEDALSAYCALSEVFFAVHEANASTPGIKAYTTCATITTDTLGTPRVMHIDFGTSGCTAPSGRVRYGKITVFQNGPYSAAGSTSTVYFDSFYINGFNYSGSFKLTTGTTAYQFSSTTLRVADTSGNAYAYNGSITLNNVSGASTAANANDDVFDLTGTIQITGRKGNAAQCKANTANPVKMVGTCAELVEGTLEITPNNLITRKLDLGSGSCDKTGNTTLNGEQQTVTSVF